MKPIRLLLTLSLLPSLALSDDEPVSQKTKWSLPKKAALGLGMFGLLSIASYYALVRAGFIGSHEQQLFGYPLDIELLEEQDKKVVLVDKHPTLFLHGWGGSKRDAHVLKYYYHALPGQVVTFNFPDAHGFYSLLTKTNLGQLNDVLAALYTLKHINDTQRPNSVDLYGHSRGGAVAINMLVVLADDSTAFDADLKRIGINDQERKELLQLLLNGSVILDCPLIDSNEVFKKHVGAGSKQWLLKNMLRLGGYNPDGMQPIKTIHKLAHLPVNIIYHGQLFDEVIGHVPEDEYCKSLAQLFPKTCVFIRGNDGGHNHNHRTLATVIHSLRTKKSHNPHLAVAYAPDVDGIGTIFTADQVDAFCATRDAHGGSSSFELFTKSVKIYLLRHTK